MDKYIAAQFAKLDPNADVFRVKVISGSSETGEFPNETHWMDATSTQIGAIRELLGEAFQPGDYYFPAFWYAMGQFEASGRFGDKGATSMATEFANFAVLKASEGRTNIRELFAEWDGPQS